VLPSDASIDAHTSGIARAPEQREVVQMSVGGPYNLVKALAHSLGWYRLTQTVCERSA